MKPAILTIVAIAVLTAGCGQARHNSPQPARNSVGQAENAAEHSQLSQNPVATRPKSAVPLSRECTSATIVFMNAAHTEVGSGADTGSNAYGTFLPIIIPAHATAQIAGYVGTDSISDEILVNARPQTIAECLVLYYGAE